jgi:hypothetical protein
LLPSGEVLLLMEGYEKWNLPSVHPQKDKRLTIGLSEGEQGSFPEPRFSRLGNADQPGPFKSRVTEGWDGPVCGLY